MKKIPISRFLYNTSKALKELPLLITRRGEPFAVVGKSGDMGKVSDGYHTFNELYEFRKLYNAALFNEWSSQGKYNVHKSWRHNDGELCFGGGWFIVMADLPTGQISNHYEEKDWELFKCDVAVEADKWDGHTAQDVAERLIKFLTNE